MGQLLLTAVRAACSSGRACVECLRIGDRVFGGRVLRNGSTKRGATHERLEKFQLARARAIGD